MSFDTIDLLTGNNFQVTWDLGRRCNYDCSYCPVTRHDNFSPHATLEELKSNVDFLFEYIDTYFTHRTFKEVSISFTGGEPTVNPNFIKFVKYLREQYNLMYKDKWYASFSLTTNGAMGQKIADSVLDNFEYCTLSYHTEADEKMKKQIKNRIKQFQEQTAKGFQFKVNVMFHAEHFKECQDICDWLKELGVKFVPRLIGEEPDSKPTFAHVYTPEQIDWMKKYWGLNAPTKKKQIGSNIGRPCCGAREMCLSSSKESKVSTFVDFRDFKGWFCSVNWFFLHLEQQTDQVFHHQTCQARFDGTRGPIGKISEGHKLVKELKEKMLSKQMDTIICPKQTCSCGLCAPKSKYKEKYMETIQGHIDTGVLA
tara:strand:- start:1092 stop:2195 length:1104 start_codon:yes stop_codon:yes gene_type:complete